MGKLETAMKMEIVRLTKKEIRPVVTPLQREVRALSRQVKSLLAETHRLARLTAKLDKARLEQIGELSVPESKMKGARMSATLIRKLRNALGVTQQQLAMLVGVSAAAVQSWEQGIAKPAGNNKSALVALRGLGRRDVAKLLTDKGIEKPGRKPRTRRAA